MTVGAGCHVTPVVSNCDGQGTFCSFFEEGAFGLVFLVGAVGVEEFGGAGAQDFEAIVKVGAGCEVLCAEAGAGVVDFEEFDGLVGVIADGGLDVWGVAAGGCGEADQGYECEFETHRVKGIRVNPPTDQGSSRDACAISSERGRLGRFVASMLQVQ